MNGWFDRAAQAYTPEEQGGGDSWQLPEPAPESGRWAAAEVREGVAEQAAADPLDAHRQLAARQPQIIGPRPTREKAKKNGWFRPGR